MNNEYPIRPMFLIGFLLCAMMIGVALFMQYYMLLEPCPLCIFQRVAVMIIGAVFLLGALHNPSTSGGKRSYGLLILLAAIGGGAISARQSWLQHLPPEKVPECGPGLSYWIDNLPISAMLSKVFEGSGECAEVQWSLFGLSIPEWTLIGFIIFGLYGLKLLIKGR